MADKLLQTQTILNAVFDPVLNALRMTIDGMEWVMYWGVPVATPADLPMVGNEGEVVNVGDVGDGTSGLYYYKSGAWHQFPSGSLWSRSGTTLIPTVSGDKVDVAAMPVGGDWELTEDLTIRGSNVAIGSVNTIGSPVTFERTKASLEHDAISSSVVIARNADSGIYNSVTENYASNDSPANTVWNSDGWSDLSDITTRTYTTFKATIPSPLYENLIDVELVMKIVSENRYFKVKFSLWGSNDVNIPGQTYRGSGEFKYTREEITDPASPVVEFERTKWGTQSDDIDAAVSIVRGANKGIFNRISELTYTDPSPADTEWNNDGWDNLLDIETRTYVSFEDALNGHVGDNILGAYLVMHIISTNRYFKILFTNWASADSYGTGEFTYTREEITLNPIEGTSVDFTHTD